MILDVAQREGSPPIGLVAQGFMPAQEFHIMIPADTLLITGLPYLLRKNKHLTVPNWKPFYRKDLYRFPHYQKKTDFIWLRRLCICWS